jgi:hypothetical protein
MDESHSAEILRFASSIIARHGLQAVGFAEAVATHFRAAGSDAEARQWASISTALHDIEQAVALPNLNPIGWPSGPEVPRGAPRGAASGWPIRTAPASPGGRS